ncbi:hypothetical protein FOA52_012043 [Chlamydomonas sp. UWO 241]|nr:hypothetical protein FOA52_012043 [Chlamydomonas sp. UWO 241]
MAPAKTESIKVVARCRPLSSKEVEDGRDNIVTLQGNNTLKVEPDKVFLLDAAFGPDSTQEELFGTVAQPIIDAVLGGYNGTIFAYGQTGSGKTHTMEGNDDAPGIMPRSFEYVAEMIAQQTTSAEYVVYLSFLEIYNEVVRDLLLKGGAKEQANNKLEVKQSEEKGVYVAGLGQHVVQGAKDMARLLRLGKKNRHTGATLMNQESSRSHCILTLTLVRVEGGLSAESTAAVAAAAVATPVRGAPAPPKAKKAMGKVSVGKLNLVDLAGSERASKSGAQGDRLKEGIAINKSLSALGNVMSALCDGKAGASVPYRESKLTRLLQDSLGGNSKTVMVANLGPADWNLEESVSTLKYAQRARSIKNAPKVNDDPADAMVAGYREQVNKLHAEYADRITKMEEQHAKEVALLREELGAIQAVKAAEKEDSECLTQLQRQLDEVTAEGAKRAAQEAEVAKLREQLVVLQQQAEKADEAERAAAVDRKNMSIKKSETAAVAAAIAAAATAAAEERAKKSEAAAAAAAMDRDVSAAEAAAAKAAAVAAAKDRDAAAAEAAAAKAAAVQAQEEASKAASAAVITSRAAPLSLAAMSSPRDSPPKGGSQGGSECGTPKGGKSRMYKDRIIELQDKLSKMQVETITDYQYMLLQSDELARLRAKMLEEAGNKPDSDEALRGLQDELEGVKGMSKQQVEQLKEMMTLVESLQARSVRPRTAALPVQGVSTDAASQGGASRDSPRSMRNDPGFNMLFEQLVLEMGYDAEASRQAIVALPAATMDEIVDYIIDKEAIFAQWRRFKASILEGQQQQASRGAPAAHAVASRAAVGARG